MTIGTQSDFVGRLRALIPTSWFPNPFPILSAVLTGFASQATAAYTLLKYAKASTRMATTQDVFLDIAAVDFLARTISRRVGEGDVSFRWRIMAEVLRLRNTKTSIYVALTGLTGRPPQVIEQWNTADAMAWGYGAWAGATNPGAGFWGDVTTPYTIFVNAYRPLASSGLVVADSEIYAMVERVKAAGVVAWVNIQN